MRRSRKQQIAISEAELVGMTNDLEDAHHETLPSMRESLVEWSDSNEDIRTGITRLVSTASSRRAFLFGGGAVLGGVALAGSGLGNGLAAAATRSGLAVPAAVPGQKLTGDLAVVALAASLENLAVATYQAGIDAATKGSLGEVPPAVVTFAQTAQSQHKDHAAAWNGVLTGAGKKAVSGVDLTVKKSVDKAFAQVKDVPGLAMLALDLENSAAATYLSAIGVVKSPAGIKTAATIQPVEMQHAAILNFVLGEYPVPDAFAKTTGARSVKDKVG
ncbi:MAG TPA: ferritin-like domain-containing protein [Acidimicrobiia bacterium]|nr:ferritin-like domain-containing protein [Acidimicrobiia bacterium]